MSVELKKGNVIKNWRGGKTIQRIQLELSGDDVRDAIQREIVRQAKKQGIELPDLKDQTLYTYTLSEDGESYDEPYICHSVLSFYVESDINPDDYVNLSGVCSAELNLSVYWGIRLVETLCKDLRTWDCIDSAYSTPKIHKDDVDEFVVRAKEHKAKRGSYLTL